MPINPRVGDITEGDNAEPSYIRSIWERARATSEGETMAFPEFAAHWNSLEEEDREDLIFLLEQSEKLERGEESLIPMNEVWEELESKGV